MRIGGGILMLSRKGRSSSCPRKVRQHYLETGHHDELKAARDAGTEEPPSSFAGPHNSRNRRSVCHMYERLTGQEF